MECVKNFKETFNVGCGLTVKIVIDFIPDIVYGDTLNIIYF